MAILRFTVPCPLLHYVGKNQTARKRQLHAKIFKWQNIFQWR